MPNCSKCGAEIIEGTKYCAMCGAAIKSDDNRRTSFEGEIRKCPNCGSTIYSNSYFCSDCGYEFRGSGTIKDFSNRYNALDTNSKKIDLIRTFPIPNTKDEIVEFAIIASSNIDENSGNQVRNSGGDSSNQELTAAWMVKLESIYHKAAYMIKDTPEFVKIEKLYKDGAKKTKRITKTSAASSFWSKNKLLLLIGLSLFIVILLVCTGIFTGFFANQRFNRQVRRIERSIKYREYELAETQIASLETDGDPYKTEIKRKLTNSVNEWKNKLIQLPTTKFSGKNYYEVKRMLENAGFINIRLEPVKKGLFNKNENVKEVSINGVTSFSETSAFQRNAEIIIYYYKK